MALPSRLGWGWVTPDEQIRDIEVALQRAFEKQGIPPALVSHLVSVSVGIFEKWDHTQHRWRAYYDSLPTEGKPEA